MSFLHSSAMNWEPFSLVSLATTELLLSYFLFSSISTKEHHNIIEEWYKKFEVFGRTYFLICDWYCHLILRFHKQKFVPAGKNIVSLFRCKRESENPAKFSSTFCQHFPLTTHLNPNQLDPNLTLIYKCWQNVLDNYSLHKGPATSWKVEFTSKVAWSHLHFRHAAKL